MSAKSPANTSSSQVNFFIPKGDAFDIGLSEYHFDEKFSEVRDLFRDRKYTVGDTDVVYRVINHWANSGLLPKGISEGEGWRKFTFVELVWIRAINRMREFGLSLDKIARAQKTIMKWNAKSQSYPEFEYYVASAWITSNPFIVILSDGQANLGFSEEIELATYLNGSIDTLRISLKSILIELGLSVAPPEILRSITRDELEVLEAIRMDNHKEVSLKLRENKITDLLKTESYPQSPPEREIRKRIEHSNAFADVVTKYENGKVQSTEVRIKKRMK